MDEDLRVAVALLKRERIVAAAVELFYLHGFGRTTLDQVAERMGVSKPFIYVHFRSKRELLAAICSQGVDAALNAIDRALAADGRQRDKLTTFAHAFMLAVLDKQKHVTIYTREEKMLAGPDREAIARKRREFDRKVNSLLNGGVASGEFEIADTPIAALAIGGIASWASVWFRQGGRLTAQEVAHRMVPLVLSMLNAAARRGASLQKA
ncbi:MAG: TetR/AcrR family transcriptional regulator [Variovorax sp.]